MAKPKRKPSPSAELLRRSKRRRLPGTSNLGGELQPGEAEAGAESETAEPLAAPRHRAARRGQRAKAAAQEETVAGEEPETAEPLAAPRQMHRAARRGRRKTEDEGGEEPETAEPRARLTRQKNSTASTILDSAAPLTTGQRLAMCGLEDSNFTLEVVKYHLTSHILIYSRKPMLVWISHHPLHVRRDRESVGHGVATMLPLIPPSQCQHL